MPTSLAEVKTVQALRLLAFKCGLTQGVRKADTFSGLERAARSHTPLHSHARILSIDMGIKNFAFSLLSPPIPNTPGGDARATVHAWRNMPLELGASGRITADPEVVKDAKAKGADNDQVPPEAFSPQAMAWTASELVSRHLLPLRPTHVLIERQRSRSGGSSAVVEWSLRINMLEAMLYALFTDMKARGEWDGELTPVLPSQVVSYSTKEFLQESLLDADLASSPDVASHQRQFSIIRAMEETLSATAARKSPKETKKHKVGIVGVMLDRGQKVTLGTDEVKATSARFLEQWRETVDAAGSRRGTRGGDPRLKLDDLADSLLQGLTWMRWQANRDVLASDDVSSLLRLYPLDNGGEEFEKLRRKYSKSMPRLKASKA
ncbi:Ydc2-catalyt-domain-containing protein [Thozetella sp. PMI_491]|nr:Ydc2-catalyt-domain-containing protein [Thozetella sp. PMI_491]